MGVKVFFTRSYCPAEKRQDRNNAQDKMLRIVGCVKELRTPQSALSRGEKVPNNTGVHKECTLIYIVQYNKRL